MCPWRWGYLTPSPFIRFRLPATGGIKGSVPFIIRSKICTGMFPVAVRSIPSPKYPYYLIRLIMKNNIEQKTI